jgi:Holliday junction resolvase-like predicted endonuclease
MEAVDGYKRERLKAAAALYLKDIAQEKTSRFDVVEVTLGKTYDPVNINYIENAF